MRQLFSPFSRMLLPVAACARHVREHCVLWLGLGSLAAGCVLWSICALFLQCLPERWGQAIGRRGAHLGFRLYLGGLRVFGAAHFDLSALDGLRDEPPMILAPNHPSMLDAVMVISRLPDLVCVLKAGIMKSFFMGAPARLAGYIPNDLFIGTISMSVAALRAGRHVLLFPEGTRTEQLPVNALQKTVLMVARRAAVPVQTLIITADTPFLGKGWPWLKRPSMPMHFSIKLGPRFAPPHDPEDLLRKLEQAYRDALCTPPGDAPVNQEARRP